MSIPATTAFSDADPELKFTTIGNLVALLRTLVSTVLPDDLMPYVVSSSTPAVNDQGKAWIRKDTSGNPLGTYLYKNGFWVREGPPPGAQWGLYFGNPQTDFNANGTGIKGPGPVAGTYYGWALLDGQGGRGNFSDKFLIGARMDNVGITGYSNGWRTNVTGAPLVTGGAASHTLTADETYKAAANAIRAAKYEADGNTPTGDLYGVTNGTSDFDILAADAGNPTPDAFSIVPPFYAAAYIQFVGYNY